jgi:ABC-2 type transport system permease protein
MSIRRILVLLRNEVGSSSRNFIVIFAILTPLLVSLALSLVFGNLFSGKPRLGLALEGDSQIPALIERADTVILELYDSAAELEEVTAEGSVDVGVVLTPGFDEAILSGEPLEITSYAWGESLARDRLIAGITVADALRSLTGEELPVDVVSHILGDAETLAFEDRLLPFIILIAVLIGGLMTPATSLVMEKQRDTLTAVVVTSARVEEIFLSKGITGTVLAVIVAVLTLLLNRAFGGEPLLLVFVLAMGAMAASGFGLMLGYFAKDITSLFATIKGIGLLLYAPAIIFLFPGVPQWIGRLFPTYYIMNPVNEITLRGAGWSKVAPDLAVLAVIILVEIGALLYIARRTRRVGIAMGA